MAVTLTTMIAQTFRVTAANITPRLTVGGVNYDTATLSALYYRTYLGASGGAGTRLDPVEFMSKTEALFNSAVAGWTVRMRTDGRIEITNAAGTWSINWTVLQPNGPIWRNLLGFSANVGSTGAGTFAQADDQAPFACFSVSRTGTPMRMVMDTATSEASDGTATSFRSGVARGEATYDFGFCPVDSAARDTLYSAFPAPTVALANPDRRFAPPAVMGTSFSQPWSWQDMLHTGGGAQCGAALGTFQTHLLGSTLKYDICTLGAKSVGMVDQDWMQPNYSKIVRVKGVALRFSAEATRS